MAGDGGQLFARGASGWVAALAAIALSPAGDLFLAGDYGTIPQRQR